MRTILLDLRDLPPPEPMQRILDALENLGPDDCIDALTPLYPAPLLAILQADGIAYRVEPVDRGHRVLIARHPGQLPPDVDDDGARP